MNNFITTIIENNPTTPVMTRFPPEPNGFLHIGHVKSIYYNFTIAALYNGTCNLRLDDTNPEKESVVFEQAIINDIQWHGYNVIPKYASDYFDKMYECAVHLISNGLAYVDEQTPDEIKENKGDFHTVGIDSPYRNRSDSLEKFEEMRKGLHPNSSMVLRAKIDMSHPNINMRDPILYRIKHTAHHRTGNKWCIYPMYAFAHPIEDAIENITYSLCTLEFEEQRILYNWVIDNTFQILKSRPNQYEFSRLNVAGMLTSKRKLNELVSTGVVSGWDDIRMPTISGLRRKGFTAEALKSFMHSVGFSKTDSEIDYSVLEQHLRDNLEHTAKRIMGVEKPIKLIISNWEDIFGTISSINCDLGNNRSMQFSKELYIEENDFSIDPPKGYKRLFIGNKVRLKEAYVIECISYNNSVVYAHVIANTKSGTPGADSIKVKSTITWVNPNDCLSIMCDSDDSKPHIIYIEKCDMTPETHYQVERNGYFVVDRYDNKVMNKVCSLRGA